MGYLFAGGMGHAPIPGGMSYGFMNNAASSAASNLSAVAGSKSPRATLAQIAGFHQKGGKRLPQRTIIVPPSPKALAFMAQQLEIAMARIMREV